MKIDIALLQSAAKKYIKTFEHHTANPLSAEALHAWDAADAELSAVINNDETNIIISLLERAEAAEARLLVPVKLPPRRSASSFVDEEFSNADLAAIYNAARLEFSVKIKNAGYPVEGGE